MQLNGHELIQFLTVIGAGGIAVSVLTKLLRKVAKGHLDADIHKVVVVLAVVASYAQYLNQLHAVLPPYIMGVSAASIYGVSQLVYRGAVTATAFVGRVQTKADSTAAPVAPTSPPTPPPAPTAGTAATF